MKLKSIIVGSKAVRRLKPTAVPSIFAWTKTSPVDSKRAARLQKRVEAKSVGPVFSPDPVKVQYS